MTKRVSVFLVLTTAVSMTGAVPVRAGSLQLSGVEFMLGARSAHAKVRPVAPRVETKRAVGSSGRLVVAPRSPAASTVARVMPRPSTAVEVTSPSEEAVVPVRKPRPAPKADEPSDSEARISELAPESPLEASVEAPASVPARVERPAADEGESLPARAPDLSIAETPEAPEAPEAPRPVVAGPAQIRAKAFANPVAFRSRGEFKALFVKVPRDLRIRLEGVQDGDALKGLQATVIDAAHDNKKTTGTLAVDPSSGGLSTEEPLLTNICNIFSIDTVAFQDLAKNGGPVKATGSIEVSGSIRPVEFTHRRIGDVAANGDMTVETVTRSTDGKVNLVTTSEMAADGLPKVATTRGTITKGILELRANLKLTRSDEDASNTGD